MGPITDDAIKETIRKGAKTPQGASARQIAAELGVTYVRVVNCMHSLSTELGHPSPTILTTTSTKPTPPKPKPKRGRNTPYGSKRPHLKNIPTRAGRPITDYDERLTLGFQMLDDEQPQNDDEQWHL